MTYIAGDESAGGVAKAIYDSKDGMTSKAFDALDWFARSVIHIPNINIDRIHSFRLQLFYK
jgi:hypothetical protein